MRSLALAIAVLGACSVFAKECAEVPSIDFAGQGVPVKRLHGLCNTLRLSGNNRAQRAARMEKLFRDLEIPETRFHDVVSENAGIQLVDVSRIFPLFHADENDPRNYVFGPTDLYLAKAREVGGELEFRFGEQIEHQVVQFQVQPPPDIDKWVRICVNIARHYNDGWANGFRWNIRRFSVWEEPDNDRLLAGAVSKGNFEKCYLKMYAGLARALKARWPEAHVGGPNTMLAGPKFAAFVDYCKAEKLPLDFAAVTVYMNTPEGLFNVVRNMRRKLDASGFAATETEISEWHYPPSSWVTETPSEILSPRAVAFTTATLTQGQVEPVDHMFFYAAYVWLWGLIDGVTCTPRPVYYAMRNFAEAAHGAVRVPGPARPAPGWYAFATRRDDGSVRLLLTAYGAKDALRLKVKGADLRQATVVVEKGEPAAFKGFTFADGELRLPKPAQDAVYLFRN